jgi:hypothetical protein
MDYVEHWIFDPTYDNDTSLTPKSRKQSIIPCQGCKLHNPYFIGNLRQNASYGFVSTN